MTTLAAPGHRRSLIRALFSKRQYALLVLILLISLAATLRNSDFLGAGNLRNILLDCTQPAIVACGVMLVIVTGEIDISVGGSLGLLTAVMGWLASPTHWGGAGGGWPPWAVMVSILALGALIGLINGILVAIVRIPSIIVTLGMFTILHGLTVLLMRPGDITDIPQSMRVLGIGRFVGIPAPFWITALVIVFTVALIHYTPLGRRIFAVGSNAHAANLAGLSAARIKIFAFTLTGLLVGVAVLVSRLGSVTGGIGQGFELLVVTCVVVGGVSMSGGLGTVSGVMLGVVLLSMQKSVLIFLDPGKGAPYWEKAIQGALILLAVLVDHLVRPPGEGDRGGSDR